MRFKNWLLKENATRTGAKLGLYPTINDALGQYPPLYGIPTCLLYTSPSPRDRQKSRMPSSA